MNETSYFKVEADKHIAWLTLNRPEKRNVMGLAFFDEIGACFDDFDRNPDIRVVVIRAEGKSFSAGTDLEEAATLVNQRSADGHFGASTGFHQNRKLPQTRHRGSPQPLYRWRDRSDLCLRYAPGNNGCDL
jgi:enoyl-CoA hydratase/carnithine racemase